MFNKDLFLFSKFFLGLIAFLFAVISHADIADCWYPSTGRNIGSGAWSHFFSEMREQRDPSLSFFCAKKRIPLLLNDILEYKKLNDNPITRATLEPEDFQKSEGKLFLQFAEDAELLFQRIDLLDLIEREQLKSAMHAIIHKVLQGKTKLTNKARISGDFTAGALQILSMYEEYGLGDTHFYFIIPEDNLAILELHVRVFK